MRPSRLNYLAPLMAAIAIAAIALGCGGDEPAATVAPRETPTPTLESLEPVTITWSFWGDPWEVEVVDGGQPHYPYLISIE